MTGGGGRGGLKALDLHIAHRSPAEWDELDTQPEQVRRFRGGRETRPIIISEKIDWDHLGLVPRWLGDDTSSAAAAIEPTLMHDRGAGEWHRLIAGTEQRGELALAVSAVGSPEEPEIGQLGGVTASVHLPGAAMGFASVGGERIRLATSPRLADNLSAADRDLALRLVSRSLDLPWWSLSLHGGEVHYGGGGASQIISPIGTFEPLLISTAGEVVAGVWTSPTQRVRHYIVPWLPSWGAVLEWLSRKAIPEYVPSAARRRTFDLGEEPDLQTAAETKVLASIAELEEQYAAQRSALETERVALRAVADEIRHGLLFSTGRDLELAVAHVLRSASIDVTDLDQLFGRSISADLLVSHAGRSRLVEIKGRSGSPSEALVATAGKHLDTWPQIRPQQPVETIVLIVNHQLNRHPLDRAPRAYTRPEFLASLTVPVITTRQLYDAWRSDNHNLIRQQIFGETLSAPPADGDPGLQEGRRRRRAWRR
jgi:hypothetical protein